MVFDSRSNPGSQIHRNMVELLKEKRAEGHFAGIQLEQSIQVYDFAVPAHAAALSRLGLTSAKAPSLCLVALNARGLPEKVNWSSKYDRADGAMLSLDAALGIQGGLKVAPIVVVVGDPRSARKEAEAKLRALTADAWKDVKISGVEVAPNLSGVASPGLALLDPGTRRVLWSKGLASVDLALQSLSTQLGTVYTVPPRLDWPTDGSVLLYVPAGFVTVGSNNQDYQSKPKHVFNLKEPYYYIGRTEVTVGQFRRFVQETGYKTDCEKTGRSFVAMGKDLVAMDGACWNRPDGKQMAPDDWPATHISFNDANTYCLWAGLRLPDEREWEHAAGSGTFPWGNQWNPALCKSSIGRLGGDGVPTAVGSYPGGASPIGALDLADNVYEWTTSIFAPYPGAAQLDPRMNGLRRVIRGGSFANDEISDYWVSKRTPVGSQDTTVAQGFRVCLGGPQSK